MIMKLTSGDGNGSVHEPFIDATGFEMPTSFRA